MIIGPTASGKSALAVHWPIASEAESDQRGFRDWCIGGYPLARPSPTTPII